MAHIDSMSFDDLLAFEDSHSITMGRSSDSAGFSGRDDIVVTLVTPSPVRGLKVVKSARIPGVKLMKSRKKK